MFFVRLKMLEGGLAATVNVASFNQAKEASVEPLLYVTLSQPVAD
jgi:hypothetical protein